MSYSTLRKMAADGRDIPQNNSEQAAVSYCSLLYIKRV